MPRGSTDLDNIEYDKWLAEQGRAAEVAQRKLARRNATKKDGSGYHFNIDPNGPVKVESMAHLRLELDKRGLAIEGEYRGKRNK